MGGADCDSGWHGHDLWKKDVFTWATTAALIIAALCFELVYTGMRKAAERSYNFGLTMLSEEDVRVRERIRAFGTPLALTALNTTALEVMKIGVSAFLFWTCHACGLFDKIADRLNEGLEATDILHLCETANAKISLTLSCFAVGMYLIVRASTVAVQCSEEMIFNASVQNPLKDDNVIMRKYFSLYALSQVDTGPVDISMLPCTSEPDLLNILDRDGRVVGQFSFSTYMAFSMNQTLQVMLSMNQESWLLVLLYICLMSVACYFVGQASVVINPWVNILITLAVLRLRSMNLRMRAKILHYGDFFIPHHLASPSSSGFTCTSPVVMPAFFPFIPARWGCRVSGKRRLVVALQFILVLVCASLGNLMINLVDFFGACHEFHSAYNGDASLTTFRAIADAVAIACAVLLFLYLPRTLVGWATLMALPPYFDPANQGLMELLLTNGDVLRREVLPPRASMQMMNSRFSQQSCASSSIAGSCLSLGERAESELGPVFTSRSARHSLMSAQCGHYVYPSDEEDFDLLPKKRKQRGSILDVLALESGAYGALQPLEEPGELVPARRGSMQYVPVTSLRGNNKERQSIPRIVIEEADMWEQGAVAIAARKSAGGDDSGEDQPHVAEERPLVDISLPDAVGTLLE